MIGYQPSLLFFDQDFVRHLNVLADLPGQRLGPAEGHFTAQMPDQVDFNGRP
jgi:hypothetical protein